MEGREDDPVAFQKKSSVFGVSRVNVWLVWPAYFLGKQRAEMQCCFLKLSFLNHPAKYKISIQNQ
jgi:hypothetical protein